MIRNGQSAQRSIEQVKVTGNKGRNGVLLPKMPDAAIGFAQEPADVGGECDGASKQIELGQRHGGSKSQRANSKQANPKPCPGPALVLGLLLGNCLADLGATRMAAWAW
jgi:hypothetical protein